MLMDGYKYNECLFMQQLKIAQVITSLGCGGAEKQLLLLCEGLQRKGHEISVGCLQSGGELKAEFLRSGIGVTEFGMASGLDVRMYFRIAEWLRQVRPQLVHTHLFKADFYGSLAASELGLPLISSKRNEDRYLKSPFYSWLVRKTANRSRKVIAISQSVRQFLVQAAGLDDSQIVVIPIGIPLQEGHSARPVNREPLHLGMVARMEEQKGHRVLLQALAQALKKCPPVRLFLYGRGSLEGLLRKTVSELLLTDTVTFCGPVLDRNLIYSNLDVLMMPSLWEGAGNVALEGMIRGIPVIASRAGGIPEYVTDECGILVEPGNVDELASAIVRVTESRSDRERMSELGVRRAMSFDFEKTLQSHLDLYRTVVQLVEDHGPA